jgi:hypothetical protein
VSVAADRLPALLSEEGAAYRRRTLVIDVEDPQRLSRLLALLKNARFRVAASDREAARALHGELSTRGRGAFAVAIADEAAAAPAALVSVRAGAGDSAVPHPALEVTVSPGAAGYRCVAGTADDWASPSLAAAAERILALCAARQLCTAIAPRGLASPSAEFSGSLAPPPAPARPRPSALAQLLRVSMGLLLNLV